MIWKKEKTYHPLLWSPNVRTKNLTSTFAKISDNTCSHIYWSRETTLVLFWKCWADFNKIFWEHSRDHHDGGVKSAEMFVGGDSPYLRYRKNRCSASRGTHAWSIMVKWRLKGKQSMYCVRLKEIEKAYRHDVYAPTAVHTWMGWK